MVLIGLSLLAYLWWLSLPSVPCVCQGWCQCGKAKSRKGSKSETRAADLARQAQQRADQQAAQQQAQQFQVAQQQQAQAFQLAQQQREQAQAEQARLEAKFVRTPEETQLLQELSRRAGLSGEQLFRDIGPSSAHLADLIQQRITTPPQIPFESTLAPALQLARDQVTNFAARRGITGSGIELESLGRAGVDLAIREAQAREQNRLTNQQLIQESLNRGMGLSQFSSGLQTQAIGEETDFEKFLRDQELRGVGLGEQALQSGLGRGFSAQEAGVGRGFSAQEAGLGQSAQRLAEGESARNVFATQGLQALTQREQAARERNAAIAQALGAAALGTATGGLGAAFPAIGTGLGATGAAAGAAGSGFGGILQGAAQGGLRSLAGLPVGQSLLEQLLNAQRGQNVPIGPGQLGYHGAGYANYPDDYRRLYGNFP